MSNDDPQNPPYPGQEPHPPNWGSAYPPPAPGSGYPPPGGYYPPQAYGYAPVVPRPPGHPNATTAMVLGIISLAGGLTCLLPVFAAPFAWAIGAKAVREIDASPGMYGGRSEANAGKIMGIVGTILMILMLLAVALLVALTISIEGFWDEDYDSSIRGALGFVGGMR